MNIYFVWLANLFITKLVIKFLEWTGT